ncbi:MAG TPA: hypothetical protein VHT75_06470 [Acidimicrobiales bacterium]|nr:hypothetical protein [Acidimicrobiales bacterium]
MATVRVVIVVALVVCLIMYTLRRYRHGIVAERGTSIGADLGALSDAPRMLVQEVATAGPDRIHVVLRPASGSRAETSLPPATGRDLYVRRGDDDFGLGLLQQWQRSGSPVAIVTPPGSRLVRLRSVDDLQHLTLRLVEDE